MIEGDFYCDIPVEMNIEINESNTIIADIGNIVIIVLNTQLY